MMHAMWGVMLAALVGAPDEELGKATKKASEMGNYTFKFTSDYQGAKGAGQPVTFEGKVASDQPLWLKGTANELFRKGEAVVVKEGEEWKKWEAPKREKGEKGEKGDRARQLAMNLATGLKAPHEEISGFETKFKEVKKAEAKENECTVYEGDLTDEAAKAIGSRGRSGKGELTHTGSAKIWVNGDGVIVKYQIIIKTKGQVGDREIDNTITRTIEISGVGSTVVEVPEGAKKLLEGTP